MAATASMFRPDAHRGVRRPGIPALPAGTERFPVTGGGAIIVRVFGGDSLRITDVEGGQAAEVVAFVGEHHDPGLFDHEARGDAAGLRALLARGGEHARRVHDWLRRHDLELSHARSIDLDGNEAGAQQRLAATADGFAVIAAPGGPMAVDGQDPPTDLTVFIDRADPARAAREQSDVPEPLAEPRVDLRVNRATARAYEVKAGQWIEVIDIAGRQCSDFQAFRRSALERGVERCVDPTATRTLIHHSYPQPGLHSKYYDVDLQPLVQIVQDDCNRHDAFALACNREYYESMGYFGHANCTDNFNRQLGVYDVAPRRAWMTMNFFYNTGIDDGSALYLDEPWSRPGDRVLMRALTDLVCVSSACPDDIDPANGWDPTDIHVRVYDADLDARRSIGFRKRPDSEVEMTQETGFHPRTSALTRNFVEYNGYWIANDFPNHGAINEYWACRERAAIMDLTALRKFEVLGPDAEALLQYCLTRNVRRMAVGQVAYTAMCYDTGTMIDDGTVFRLGRDNFRWIGGSDFGGDWLRRQAAEHGFDARVKSATNQLHNVSVQGPSSRDILKQIVWTRPDQPNVEELDLFRFSIGRLNHEDGQPLIISRTGYTGELGYEVFCHPTDAPVIWDTIMSAGEPCGLTPMGLEALDMLRIEAGLAFAGHEFDDQTDPFEAGIGFTVPLKSKQEDFIGRAALERRKEHPQRKLVGLEIDSEEPVGHGDCVHAGRPRIGVVTSAMRSPVLQKNIALCRIDVAWAELGNEVEIGKLDGQQKRLQATVVQAPHYDPKKERMKM